MWDMASIKFKKSMNLFLKDMAGLQGTLKPKGEISAWVPNCKIGFN